MDFIDLNFSDIVVSKKKAIPVHYQKRYKANLSNSVFNQSFALGVYKRKVKSLIENNKQLATAVQNYKCESSLKEKMQTEASSANMEHLFSARLKLNKLAEVLKNSYSSVQEILSELQLNSSVFPTEFAVNNRKSCSKRSRRGSKVSSIETIKEGQERSSADVLLSHIDGSNPVSPSSLKNNECGVKSILTNLFTKTNESVMLQEGIVAHKSVELAAEALSLTETSFSSTTKSPKRVRKLRVRKGGIKRKSSVSNANKRLPNKRSPNFQTANCIPVSDEVLPILQDDSQQTAVAKKSKLSIEPVAVSDKRLSVKQKLPLSSKKNNKSINTPDPLSETSDSKNAGNFSAEQNQGNGIFGLNNRAETPVSLTESCLITDPLFLKESTKKIKNKYTSSEVSENGSTENFYDDSNQANGPFDLTNQSETPASMTMSCLITNQDDCDIEINHLNLPKDPEKNIIQSRETSVSSCEHNENLHDSEDLVQKDTFKSATKPKAQKPSKINQGNHEQCNDNLTDSSNGNNTSRSIMVTKSAKYSANKYKAQNKVKFCFDDDAIDKVDVKSTQRKKKLPKKLKVSENEKGILKRPVLGSVENISYLSENLSKNIFVVSAEVHPPPSWCVKKPSISPRNVSKNMQPCVLLTDIFDSHKSISSYASLDDITSCSEVLVKEDSKSKVSKHENTDSAINTENSLPATEQSERALARCRSAVSYREPPLNRKMRRI